MYAFVLNRFVANNSGKLMMTGTQPVDSLDETLFDGWVTAGKVRAAEDSEINTYESNISVPASSTVFISAALSDETTALASSEDALISLAIPFNMGLTKLKFNLNASSSDGNLEIDVKRNGTSILNDPIVVEEGETIFTLEATSITLVSTNLDEDDIVSVFLNEAGDAAAGLKVSLIGFKR